MLTFVPFTVPLITVPSSFPLSVFLAVTLQSSGLQTIGLLSNKKPVPIASGTYCSATPCLIMFSDLCSKLLGSHIAEEYLGAEAAGENGQQKELPNANPTLEIHFSNLSVSRALYIPKRRLRETCWQMFGSPRASAQKPSYAAVTQSQATGKRENRREMKKQSHKQGSRRGGQSHSARAEGGHFIIAIYWLIVNLIHNQ